MNKPLHSSTSMRLKSRPPGRVEPLQMLYGSGERAGMPQTALPMKSLRRERTLIGRGSFNKRMIEKIVAMTAATVQLSLAKTISKQDLVDQTQIRLSDPIKHRLMERGVQAVLNGTVWLTSKEVGLRADPKAANPHAFATRLASQGKVFAIERAGVKHYPEYAFDPLGNPIAELKDVISILKGLPSFRIASWFESTSSFLNGKRPREVLAISPAEVIDAARAFVDGPLHG